MGGQPSQGPSPIGLMIRKYVMERWERDRSRTVQKGRKEAGEKGADVEILLVSWGRGEGGEKTEGDGLFATQGYGDVLPGLLPKAMSGSLVPQ